MERDGARRDRQDRRTGWDGTGDDRMGWPDGTERERTGLNGTRRDGQMGGTSWTDGTRRDGHTRRDGTGRDGRGRTNGNGTQWEGTERYGTRRDRQDELDGMGWDSQDITGPVAAEGISEWGGNQFAKGP